MLPVGSNPVSIVELCRGVRRGIKPMSPNPSPESESAKRATVVGCCLWISDVSRMHGRRGKADSYSDGDSSFAVSGSRRYEPTLVLRKWGGGTKVRIPTRTGTVTVLCYNASLQACGRCRTMKMHT